MCDRMAATPWLARTQDRFARMLVEGATDREGAVEMLTSALATCDDSGMTSVAARVAYLLAQLGVRSRPRGPRRGVGVPNGAPLTPREREVAALVAEGLSNRQIANQLYLSERTAETHVQNILTKLGFGSRAEVAAWAAREGHARDGT